MDSLTGAHTAVDCNAILVQPLFDIYLKFRLYAEWVVY